MNLRLGIPILVVVLLASMVACSGDDTLPANLVITGNTETVDFHETFDPPRRGSLAEEFRSTAYNAKIYQDSVDFDQNGTYDLKIEYLIERRISGDTLVTTKMGPLHSDLFLLGETVIFGNISYWEPRVHDKGKEMTPDGDFWDTTSESGLLYDFDYWFKVARTGFVDDFTRFPVMAEGYVIFKLNSGAETKLGWLKIKLSNPGRVPEIENIGYKIF